MRRRAGLIGSESGQGVLEYILILFIVVTIIFTILYRFSTAFRAYGNNYFTNYIACLLEMGELPGSGSCTAQMASFNLADGTELGGPGPGSGGPGGSGNPSDPGSKGGSGSNGSSSSDGSDQGKDGKGADKSGSGDKSLADDPSAASDTGGGGGSSGGGGGGAVGRFGRFGKARSTAVGTANVTSEEANTQVADSLLGVSPTSAAVGNVAGGRRRVTNLTWGYAGEAEQAEREKTRPPVSALSAPVGENGESLKPKSVVEKVRESTKASVGTEDDGFTFGKFIKILLIVAIVLAIAIFFGGQILQITKSWDS